MPFNCHSSRCQESRDKQALGNPKSKRWNRNLNLDDAIPTVIFFTRTPIHEMVLRLVFFGGIISEPVYAVCSSFAAALKKAFVQYIHLWEFCQDFTWKYGGVVFESVVFTHRVPPASSIKRGPLFSGDAMAVYSPLPVLIWDFFGKGDCENVDVFVI